MKDRDDGQVHVNSGALTKHQIQRRHGKFIRQMLLVGRFVKALAHRQEDQRSIAEALARNYEGDLVSSGASVKTCQTLARHSTPSLTIGIYAKTSLHDIKGAVENLPDLTPQAPRRESVAATGTDGLAHRAAPKEIDSAAPEPEILPVEGQRINDRFAPYLPLAGEGLRGGQTVTDVMTGSDDQSSMEKKPLKNKGSDASRRDAMASEGSAPRRTRTYNPLIKSQVLSISQRGSKEHGHKELGRWLFTPARCRVPDFTGILQSLPKILRYG
jgi:hypothetical protein